MLWSYCDLAENTAMTMLMGSLKLKGKLTARSFLGLNGSPIFLFSSFLCFRLTSSSLQEIQQFRCMQVGYAAMKTFCQKLENWAGTTDHSQSARQEAWACE